MKVKINDEIYEVPNRDELEIDEMIAIEEATGIPGPRWENEGGFKLIKGLVWIGMRRCNPSFKYDDARFKLSDVEADEDELAEALGKDDSA